MIIASDIELLRGGKPLITNTSAKINPGQKVGLVGKNGCGKSSLFALIRHEISLDNGSLTYPTGWQVSSVKQETPALDRSAHDYVLDGDIEFRQLEADLAQAEAADNGNKIAEIHGKLDAIGAYSINARCSELLSGLGFSEDKQQLPVQSFSGGWRMRLNLAQALLCRSDLLLLDEPTNHLDLDAVIWLEKWLKQYDGTLMLISHDRDFLDAIITKIIHVEDQKLNEYTGDYTSFEKQRAEKLSQQQSMFEKQQREVAHMQSYIDRFRYKASKAKQAQSRIKAMERMELISAANADSQFSFSFLEPDALPLPLLTMENVCAGYGDTLILDNIKLNLVPGSRIGLLGRNGAGKSTLIKLLSAEMEPLKGSLEVNPNSKVGYFAQHQLEFLRLDDTPLQHMVRLAPDKTELELRKYLGGFGFIGEKALDIVRPFSGGEKARLVLALIVWQKPNLLLLDEPTNHLDLEMRHALSVALQGFEGAMIVVSHDRHLLRSTTDELYLVHDKKVLPFDGDLDDYHTWLAEQQKVEKQATQVVNTSANSAQGKKDQKRKAAELRKQTQPVRKHIEKLDKQLETLGDKLTAVEAQLSETSIYEDQNKAKLKTALSEQAKFVVAIEEAETTWMELNEELEEMIEASEQT
ncbi:ABC transporter ATP-binding protein [Moritella marina ATCC 15381]|uniref:Probable ATP-binding protein YheS n=1 Tax=Moritella marina ATCC 15381 TaxID=1202962 RepID=A0A5J6WUD2_MORMI|nr:ABC transporter ATP-binding protein [Moritella marina]QFI40002.1 ABC transporter ATP-binding protein [Moritella marina ATCC 15381]